MLGHTLMYPIPGACVRLQVDMGSCVYVRHVCTPAAATDEDSRQEQGLQHIHTWPDVQICAAACSCLGALFHVLTGTGCLPGCLQSLLVGVTS